MGVVGSGGGSRRAVSLLVCLDVPVRRVRERVEEVVDAYVGIGVEGLTVFVGVDRRTHRFEIVADDEQRAAWRHRGEQVVDAAVVGGARDGRVLRCDEVEGFDLERAVCVGVGVVARDGHSALIGGRGDTVERALRDVVGGDIPAVLGEPDRVAALAGSDVERAARGQAGDLVDERAVGVAAPQLAAGVAVVPVGLVC